MALTAGERLGSYEISGLLGAGGMGEVYRARDKKLGRWVALKVLPSHLAADADYLARFEREAQVLASLNHPNIAGIYGLEGNAIVLELVEGRTLAERGGLPVEEALACARQIAEALEAAHERGIIHRDLKPANVKVTPEGTVKVLDFGLAKINEAPAAGSVEQSPTLTARATQAGVILGTAAYMSPEQAAGKIVDRRADIWAFGVVLFEMLSGRQLFQGESVPETLAAVLKSEIDFANLPHDTPPAIRDLLTRCLDRKVKTRLQSIGEARIAIDRELEHPSAARTVAPPRIPSRMPWAVAALFAVLAAASLLVAWRAAARPSLPVLRFTEDLGPEVTLVDASTGPTVRTGPNVVISPDGSRLVYVALDADNKTYLWTRRLDQPNAARLEGTEGALGPFFSPNGKWVGFFASGKLKKAGIDGGILEICGTNGPMSADWGDDGYIYAVLSPGGVISRISEAGGSPHPVTKLGAEENSHRWVRVLPGSRAILYAAGLGGRFHFAKVIAQRLDTGERKTLWSNASFPRYLRSGHLTFISNGTLYAVPFDTNRLEIGGVPVAVLQGVKDAPASGGAQMDVSSEGTLVYRSADQSSAGTVLAWIDQAGNREDLPLPQGTYGTPALSPDGKRVAFRKTEGARADVWVHDFERKTTTRLTFDAGDPSSPRWSHDGVRVLYASGDGMYWSRADGSSRPVRLLVAGWPAWVSTDGKYLGYVETLESAGRQCKFVTIEGDPEHPHVGQPQPCFDSTIPTLMGGELSRDGRWLLYGSGESGEPQVYVRSFPDRGGRWQVSTNGGSQPRWSADGRRVFYISPDSRLMLADVDPRSETFSAFPPRPWMDDRAHLVLGGATANYSPSADGKRMLVALTPSREGKRDARVRIVLNFFEEVRRRLQTAETH